MVIDSMRASGVLDSVAVLDRDPSLWGQEILAVPVLGGDELLADLAVQGVTNFVVGLGGIGDNQPRRQLFELGLSHGLKPMNVVHPSAVCSPWVKLGAGTVVLPTAVINAGAILGDNVIVNS